MSIRGRNEHGRRAFTLIELLVVIAILGLLISILVPSIAGAKELAKKVICQSHLHGAGNGIQLYTSEYNGWLAGPNTSGLHLSVDYNRYDGSDVTDVAEPTQNMDWVSPTMGVELGLTYRRSDRLTEIFNTALRCPSNQDYYDGEYTGGSGSGEIGDIDPASLRYSSYSAALGFHVMGDNQVTMPMQVTEVTEARSLVQVHGGYLPKVSQVGDAERKVYAMDGARYIDDAGGVTFNAFMRQLRGGNFMLYGPAAVLGGDPFRWEEVGGEWKPSGIGARYAYRHRGEMNVVYFDGHAGSLTVEQSWEAALFFPTGSVSAFTGDRLR